MKGEAVRLTRTVVIVLILLIFFGTMTVAASELGLSGILRGTCGNGICEAGETEALCPQDCTVGQMNVTFEHIMINSVQEDIMTISSVKDWLDYPPSGEEEDCLDCTVCSGCSDTQDYELIEDCKQCMNCDEFTGECEFCGNCTLAKSDYSLDPTRMDQSKYYEDCETCFECSGCIIESGMDYSDHCDSCSYCETCLNPNNYETSYAKCDYCSYNTDGTPTGCTICYNSADTTDSMYYNICKECTSCDTCEASEPWLCRRLKKGISLYDQYNPYPYLIDADLPVYGADPTTDIHTHIIETLARCKDDDKIFYELSDSGKQYLCTYDVDALTLTPFDLNSDFFGAIGGEVGVLPLDFWQYRGDMGSSFTLCGYTNNTLDAIYYNTLGFNGTYPGMHYRIALGRVNFGTGHDNKCKFNLYVCGQPSFITTESELYSDPLAKVYKKMLSLDAAEFEKNYIGDEEDTDWVWASGITTQVQVNFGNEKRTPEEVADAILAGLRDWEAISRGDEETLNTFKDLGCFGILGHADDWNLYMDHGDVAGSMYEEERDIIAAYHDLDDPDDFELEDALAEMREVKFYGNPWTLKEINPRTDACKEGDDNYLWHTYDPLNLVSTTGTELYFVNPYISGRWRTKYVFKWTHSNTEEDHKTHIKLIDLSGDEEGTESHRAVDECGVGDATIKWYNEYSRPDQRPDQFWSWVDQIKLKSDCGFADAQVCAVYNILIDRWWKTPGYMKNSNVIYYEKTDDGMFDGRVDIGVMFVPRIRYDYPYEQGSIILIPIVSFAEAD